MKNHSYNSGRYFLPLFFTLLFSFSFHLKGFTQDTLIIESTFLSSKQKIITYNFDSLLYPTIYFLDGEKFLHQGLLDTLKKLTLTKKIVPANYIFISTIDPETKTDHRNDYFFCTSEYYSFIQQEVIPSVEKNSPLISSTDRLIIGASFGGLEVAHISTYTENPFSNFALLSPVTYPCNTISKEIVLSKHKHFKLYISTGKNDAENYISPLVTLYNSKNCDIQRKETNGAHDFNNWINQIEALSIFFFPFKS